MYFLRAIRPIAADFLSTIVFIAVYEVAGNIIAATVAGIATGVAQFFYLRLRGRAIDRMQWASLALVIVLGSATLVTRDARFVMAKPSLASFAIGCAMLDGGWLLRYLPQIVKDNVRAGVLAAWGHAWAALMFLLCAVNLLAAFMLGIAGWAVYAAIVPNAAMLCLFLVQYASLRAAVRRNIRARAVSGTTAAPTIR